jgi:hypothetical protein
MNNQVIPKRLVSIICILYLVHSYQKHQSIEEKLSLEQISEEKEEATKRKENLRQLLAKPKNDTLEDLTTLLENLEEVILALKYIKEENWIKDEVVHQGYITAATCLKGLLTQSPNQDFR